MRLSIATAASLAALLSSASAISLFGSNPKVEATATWPATNSFGHVFNGQKNAISVLVENKADVEIDIKKVYGAFSDPSTEKVVRNTSELAYKVSIPSKNKLTLPYTFHTELKPQDMRLKLFVEFTAGGQPYQVQAFDSVVSVKEPPASLFDLQLIVTYLMIFAILCGGAYLAYVSYFPAKKVKAKPIDKQSKALPSVPKAATTGATSGYEEEWIPEHHLRSRTVGKKVKGAASSGEESTPDKKTRTRKRG